MTISDTALIIAGDDILRRKTYEVEILASAHRASVRTGVEPLDERVKLFFGNFFHSTLNL